VKGFDSEDEMDRGKSIYLIILLLVATTMACSISGIRQQAQTIEQTSRGLRTEVRGFVTTQAVINLEIPTGEAPTDIPVISREQTYNYFGSNQYILYISPTQYSRVLEFYKTEMLNNDWRFLQNESYEYDHAAQLNYFNDARTTNINLSYNPLNNTTTVVIISIGTH
jgi:hypothetical protein